MRSFSLYDKFREVLKNFFKLKFFVQFWISHHKTKQNLHRWINMISAILNFFKYFSVANMIKNKNHKTCVFNHYGYGVVVVVQYFGKKFIITSPTKGLIWNLILVRVNLSPSFTWIYISALAGFRIISRQVCTIRIFGFNKMGSLLTSVQTFVNI